MADEHTTRSGAVAPFHVMWSREDPATGNQQEARDAVDAHCAPFGTPVWVVVDHLGRAARDIRVEELSFDHLVDASRLYQRCGRDPKVIRDRFDRIDVAWDGAQLHVTLDTSVAAGSDSYDVTILEGVRADAYDLWEGCFPPFGESGSDVADVLINAPEATLALMCSYDGWAEQRSVLFTELYQVLSELADVPAARDLAVELLDGHPDPDELIATCRQLAAPVP
jgi:hypothetical protein